MVALMASVWQPARSAGGVGSVIRALLLASMATAATGAAWSQADEARAKKIVGGSCIICHGAQGESTSELFPKLAGQHAEYISRQLANFKSGTRKNRDMADMVARLKADEMQAIGRYYEKMQLPKEPVRDAELAARGKAIYRLGNPTSGLSSCASCHGADALGSAALPRLAGQIAGYTETQLKHFQTRERTNDNADMQAVARAMSPAEMAAVAHYLESQ